MNFDILRQRILEKAIQGKLVPQLESEPDVAQISETLDDVPFAVPEKWKWVRILDAACINPKVIATDSNINVSFIPMAAVSAGYLNYIALKEEKPWKTVKNGYTKFADRDILIAKITPCFQNRKSAIAHSLINGIGCGSSEFHVLRTNENILDQNYLLLFLKSPWFIAYGVENFKGTAGQQRLGTSELKNCRLPLPPLSEQRRIVAKTEKLFEQISRAEEAYNEISGPLSERFRQLCLEKAIQGKLVPQLESEPETDRTISSVKEAPFKIPEKWQWCKLSDALEIQNGDRGKNYPSKSKLTDNNTGLPFVSALNLESFKISHKNLLYLYPEQYEKLRSGHIKINDCLLCIRGSLGKFGFATQSGGAIASSLVILRSKDDSFISSKYLKIFLQSLFFKEQINLRQNGTAQPNLSAKDLSNFLIPIPPVAEQRRIASKFEEICKIMKII